MNRAITRLTAAIYPVVFSAPCPEDEYLLANDGRTSQQLLLCYFIKQEVSWVRLSI